MSHAWRIDTLDPRGGLSFASWREPTLFNDTLLEDAPVFFIGAPDFAPQAIANRSVALAAERHGFQLGLLDSEGEVEFEDLTNVAEFVRRLYLTSSRGDPTVGGTAPPPPPDEPPFDGGEALSPSELPSPLASAIGIFMSTSKKLSRGKQKYFPWAKHLKHYDPDRPIGPQNQLRRGAIVLVKEILWRFPVSRTKEDLERWRQVTHALIGLLWSLELVLELRGTLELKEVSKKFLMNTWNEFEHWHQDENPVDAVLNIMEGGSIYAIYGFYSDNMKAQNLEIEPMDLFAMIPVPIHLAEGMNVPEPARASLATILSVGLGDPSALATHPDIEALITLAAARVAVVDISNIATASWRYPPNELTNATQSYRQEKLTVASQNWLVRNLPAIVFDPALEEMISENGSTMDPSPRSTRSRDDDAPGMEFA